MKQQTIKTPTNEWVLHTHSCLTEGARLSSTLSLWRHHSSFCAQVGGFMHWNLSINYWSPFPYEFVHHHPVISLVMMKQEWQGWSCSMLRKKNDKTTRKQKSKKEEKKPKITPPPLKHTDPSTFSSCQFPRVLHTGASCLCNSIHLSLFSPFPLVVFHCTYHCLLSGPIVVWMGCLWPLTGLSFWYWTKRPTRVLQCCPNGSCVRRDESWGKRDLQ